MLIQALKNIHPALRPILAGVALFGLFNLVLTIGITCSPLNQKFNFRYGNFLPAKMQMLKSAHPEKLDVLFMGTSQTNNGFVTSVFERAAGRPVNSFNLGLPNNRYDIMLSYLRMHVQHYGKPRVLLVELSPSIQEKNSALYYLPALYYRSLIESDPALAATYLNNPHLPWNVKQELLFSGFSSLRQYRHTFSPLNALNKVSGKLRQVLSPPPANAQTGAEGMDFEGVQAAQASSTQIDPAMTEKGWYPKEQSPNMTTPDGVRLSVAEARKYYIDAQREVHFDKLKALLAYCRAQQIPVVLVSWPNHPAYVKVFDQSALSRSYTQGLSQLLVEEPVPLINLNAELNAEIPATQRETEGGLFSDPRHLTPEGARHFSEKLAHRVFGLALVQQQFSKTVAATDIR